jgi:GSH-dependent disulfide-bond oxidoreductase
MIDLHYWPTPNGHKITIALEEMGLEYQIFRVNIGTGDQFKPDFLKIAPNNRMPAIVDHKPADGGAPIDMFESGAILQYLAEKTGTFLPKDVRGRFEAMKWLYWQMGGLGPMAGQSNHFSKFAPEKVPYGIERYAKEAQRLFGVLNKRLADRPFVAGEYSIADMASYPWTLGYATHGINIDDLPHLKRWQEAIGARPAVVRAYAKANA